MALTGGAAYAMSHKYTDDSLEGAGALKGKDGKPFKISKTYETIDDMYADLDPIEVDEYACIQSNVEDKDNAKLFKKTTSGYMYITDMSGSDGISSLTNIKPVEHNLNDGGSFEIPKSFFNRAIDGESESVVVYDNYGNYQSVTLTEKDSSTYFAVPSGDIGSIGRKVYTHIQNTASDEWRIQHNLNFRYPAILLLDDDGNEIEGNINYFSDNLLIVTFSNAVKGKGIVSK